MNKDQLILALATPLIIAAKVAAGVTTALKAARGEFMAGWRYLRDR